jgi:hypothetical protein
LAIVKAGVKEWRQQGYSDKQELAEVTAIWVAVAINLRSKMESLRKQWEERYKLEARGRELQGMPDLLEVLGLTAPSIKPDQFPKLKIPWMRKRDARGNWYVTMNQREVALMKKMLNLAREGKNYAWIAWWVKGQGIRIRGRRPSRDCVRMLVYRAYALFAKEERWPPIPFVLALIEKMNSKSKKSCF